MTSTGSVQLVSVRSLLDERSGLRLVLPPDDMATVLFALSNGLAVESGIDPDVVPEDLFGKVLVLLAGPQD